MDRVRLKRKYILPGCDQTDIPRTTRHSWKKRKAKNDANIDQPNQDSTRGHGSSDAWMPQNKPALDGPSSTTEDSIIDDSQLCVLLGGLQHFSGVENSNSSQDNSDNEPEDARDICHILQVTDDDSTPWNPLELEESLQEGARVPNVNENSSLDDSDNEPEDTHDVSHIVVTDDDSTSWNPLVQESLSGEAGVCHHSENSSHFSFDNVTEDLNGRHFIVTDNDSTSTPWNPPRSEVQDTHKVMPFVEGTGSDVGRDKDGLLPKRIVT